MTLYFLLGIVFQADEDQDDADERWDPDSDVNMDTDDRYVFLIESCKITCFLLLLLLLRMLTITYLLCVSCSPLSGRVKREFIEPEANRRVCFRSMSAS